LVYKTTRADPIRLPAGDRSGWVQSFPAGKSASVLPTSIAYPEAVS
jgi:hypothetical protein